MRSPEATSAWYTRVPSCRAFACRRPGRPRSRDAPTRENFGVFKVAVEKPAAFNRSRAPVRIDLSSSTMATSGFRPFYPPGWLRGQPSPIASRGASHPGVERLHLGI